jgi:tRNA(fMet)-specific endonuclease VapC
MYLLDTNILTALHAGNSKVISAIQRLDDPQIAITIITKVEVRNVGYNLALAMYSSINSQPIAKIQSIQITTRNHLISLKHN